MAKKTATRKTAKKAARREPLASRKKGGSRRTKARRPPEPAWVKELRKRKQPLSLAIDEQGHIAFWKYSFDGPHDYNLMAWHPEGDLDFGFDEPASGDDDFCELAISEWDNEYRPGHPIHDALTPKERKLFGITQGDAGGPASDGCMVVAVKCTLDDLNTLIRKKGLPFVVVEDKRRALRSPGAFPRIHSPRK